MSNPRGDQNKPSDLEQIKVDSNYLRGTIREGLLDDVTGALAESDTKLTKFHGIYQQDDRDLRPERQKQKLEPHYQFMVRLRLPGGVLQTDQWLALDQLAHERANGQLRLTTRQTFQFHYVLKPHLRPLLQGINAAGLDTRGACGDDNRNVICNTNPARSESHGEVYEWARTLSDHLRWKSSAYDETWLGKEPTVGQSEEPLYGETYLPRKFKFAIAIPPENDCDVHANDVGLIAIVEDGKLAGFNVAIGGGMGMVHSEPESYPRIGSVIGFCEPEQLLEVAEALVGIQRDYGDRSNRGRARFKYTIDDFGLDWVKDKLDERLGWKLPGARDYHFESNGDRYGWVEGENGNWHCTVFVQNGRISDTEKAPVMSGFREVAKVHKGEFRITCNQNIIVANVAPEDKDGIDALLREYKLRGTEQQSALRLNTMACVALPTCGLAMAESERYMPTLVGKLEAVMKEAGLEEDPITMRMTGCPNGCARPYLAEIGFVGKSLGHYQIYLGGGFAGQRMNKLYRDSATEEEILSELSPIIHRYAKERKEGEHFGDFVIRKEYVKATHNGMDFHD